MSPAAPPRAPRCRVDGVLLLDKPPGLTSNAALQHARRLYNAAKAGHTGTLDPLATGLLPICFGEATKFAQALLDAPKRYTATIRFGATTTTGDAEGDVIEERPIEFDRDALQGALMAFHGAIEQLPPRYAALKHRGRPYYEYARAGQDVPRAKRTVTIHALRLIDWLPPDAVVDVECSKGTYVRTLAEDLGQRLGSGAHLRGLRRTATGGFDVADAWTLDALAALDAGALAGALLPVDGLLRDVPRIDVDPGAAAALRQGQCISVDAPRQGVHRVYGAAAFLGLVDIRDGLAQPLRLARTN